MRTATIKRGDLSRTLSAKGTVKLEEVEVGTQMTGMIASLRVRSGRSEQAVGLWLARSQRHGLGTDRLRRSTRPRSIMPKRRFRQAKANLVQLQAKRDQTEQEWKRAESLRPAKAIADSDYDLALTNFRMAEANVTVGEAAVQESEASLRIAKTNLAYTSSDRPTTA